MGGRADTRTETRPKFGGDDKAAATPRHASRDQTIVTVCYMLFTFAAQR